MKATKESKPGRVSTSGSPNPVDVHVGQRIRLRRTLLGYSQQFMANKLGLTFQQVQKYEKGCNRVGASRLWDISKVLQVSMDFFFADMDKDVQDQSPMMQTINEEFVAAEDIEGLDTESANQPTSDPMHKKETIELVNAYYRIPNRKVAKHMFELMVKLSKSDAGMQVSEDNE